MKDKIVDFIKNKGYIFIALICLFALVVAGVSVIRSGNNTNNDPVISYSTPVSKPILPTDSPKNTLAPQSTPASKPVEDSQNGNSAGNNQNTTGEIVLTKPVDGEIQAEFAAKKLVYNTTLQEWRTHSGVDIEAAVGSTVKAAAKGTISAIKSDPRYGLTVVIDHTLNGRNFSTVYCGLSKTAEGIVVGSEVNSGAAIGVIGEDIFCEKAQGAHLHFELTEDSVPLNPTQYWK